VMEQTAGMSPLEALSFATPLIEKLKLELTISAGVHKHYIFSFSTGWWMRYRPSYR